MSQNTRNIFLAAVEIDDPHRRAAYLAEACCGDEALRQNVEELLRAHDVAGSFLADDGAPFARTVTHTGAADAPGTQIGPYKLLERIGEGGFGIVYMAEQEQPVRRRVALKIIKPGMDTAQVIARFEAERQALAIMEHPHIAKVYDAGATESGRPYFVMELVRGVPITEFCDKNRMPAEQRLKLFVDVCHAVQHAHHKGVIHRDLKPSNVLVTLHDGVPVVKVIDFGIAKAMGRELTDRTLFTAFAQLVGTPLYMSPEQAEMSGLDIDTRSDIYSLGVLLYELLTGTTPLESQRVHEAGYAELQRLIREEESPPPSTRLSSLGESATVAAGNRGADPRQLARLLAGEIDWIVMKALAKDRNRRYSTPGDFAADIERYLRRDLVLARPPSTAYRMKKFVQRNRVAVVTGSAITGALVVGLVLATWGMFAARDAERRAVTARNAEAVERTKADAALAAEALARKTAEEQAIRLRVERALPKLQETQGAFSDYGDSSARSQFKTALLELSQILLDVPDHLPEWKEYLSLNVLAWGQHLAPLVPMPTHNAFDVTDMKLSPDRRLLLTRGKDGSRRLWDFPTLQPRVELEQGELVQWSSAIAFTPDGHTLWAIAGSDPSEAVALFWEVRTGRVSGRIPNVFQQMWNSSATTADGSRLFTDSALPVPDKPNFFRADGAHLVQLFDVKSGSRLFELAVNRPCNADFSADGRYLAILVREEPRVRIVSAGDGQLLKTLEFDTPVWSMRFSPSGAHLVTLIDNEVRWWRAGDWQSDGQAARNEWTKGQPFSGTVRFFAEDLIGVSLWAMDAEGTIHNHDAVHRQGQDGRLPFPPLAHCRGDLLLSEGGKFFNRTTLEAIPVSDRRFPPEAAQFAHQGRLLPLGEQLIDLATELPVGRRSQWESINAQDVGLVLPAEIYYGDNGPSLSATPWTFLPEHPDALHPQAVALWARVVVRGELGGDGAYVPWDEERWHARRKELLLVADTHGKFPFPGAVATDSLYWVRQAIKENGAGLDRSWNSWWSGMSALHDRLVAAEPSWPNYARRALHHFSNYNTTGNYVQGVRDQLEAARLAGLVFWKMEWESSEGWGWPFRIALQPGQPASDYELILRWAEGAKVSGERNVSVVAALALYRLARYADALQEVNFAGVASSDLVGPVAEGGWSETPNAPLVAAMCSFASGEREVARTLFQRVQARAKELDSGDEPGNLQAGISSSGINHNLLREARQLIEPPAGEPPPQVDGSAK